MYMYMSTQAVHTAEEVTFLWLHDQYRKCYDPLHKYFQQVFFKRKLTGSHPWLCCNITWAIPARPRWSPNPLCPVMFVLQVPQSSGTSDVTTGKLICERAIGQPAVSLPYDVRQDPSSSWKSILLLINNNNFVRTWDVVKWFPFADIEIDRHWW